MIARKSDDAATVTMVDASLVRAPAARTVLSWDLVVCTYNRPDVLVECIRATLAQTRPPSTIIIVDASDDWESSRETIASLTASAGTALIYEAATVRSSAVQRNQGASRATADILFMIDDDSLMYPDCAETIMRAYEADTAEAVAAIGAVDAPLRTETHDLSAVVEKKSGLKLYGRWLPKLSASRLGRFVLRDVLMMAHDKTFLPYDKVAYPPLETPANLAALGLRACYTIAGFSLTVRRKVALREPFDTILRYYAALEDSDACERFSRHGQLMLAENARLHHYYSAGGRLSRKAATMLLYCNLAVFLRRHSSLLPIKRGQYHARLRRRLIAEFLKDMLAGRFTVPQARAVLFAMAHADPIFDKQESELADWYPEFQRQIVEANPA
jgi:GT2 family glycosyltransferase